jgi:hypothetical protein
MPRIEISKTRRKLKDRIAVYSQVRIVKSQRIDGQPRKIVLEYLGSLEEAIDRLDSTQRIRQEDKPALRQRLESLIQASRAEEMEQAS